MQDRVLQQDAELSSKKTCRKHFPPLFRLCLAQAVAQPQDPETVFPPLPPSTILVVWKKRWHGEQVGTCRRWNENASSVAVAGCQDRDPVQELGRRGDSERPSPCPNWKNNQSETRLHFTAFSFLRFFSFNPLQESTSRHFHRTDGTRRGRYTSCMSCV